jgi:hypothetical protein
MIDLLGITIHEPDVVFTDLGLAVLGTYFGRSLWMRSSRGTAPRAGAVLMAGLASAAFWGALFHAFFPDDTTTLPGFVAWIPVILSIILAAAAMLQLGLRILLPGLPAPWHRGIVMTYVAIFAGVVLFHDESFTSIVRFYVPALAFLIIAAARQAAHRTAGGALVLSGLLISALAAVLQQAGVAIHPSYFDHNAVYHVVQSTALVFLYLGFRRAAGVPMKVYASGADPAPRPG